MIIKEPFNDYLKRGWFTSPSAYKSCKTASEVWYKRAHPESSTKQVFVFGHLVHTMLLELELFESSFVVDDYKKYPRQEYNNDDVTISLRPTANRQYRARMEYNAQMDGKELITVEMIRLAKEMVKGYYYYNPEVSGYLLNPENAMIETSFYGKAIFYKGVLEGFGDIPDLDYKPEPNEMLIKTRPDYLKPGQYYLDVKTCESALPAYFARDCVNYGYDVQAAFILDFINFMLDLKEKTFIFLALEKSEPYQAVPFIAPERMIETGRAKYQTRLEKLHATTDNGYLIYAEHPGMPYVMIPFPNYAVKTKNDVIQW